MSIADCVARVQEEIAEAAIKAGRNPEDISLVAATKTQSHEAIVAGIQAGVTICGENRVQEMVAHQKENSYQGARLDFIGHLQRNKIKQVVGQVDLIQSVSSRSLMEDIGKYAEKCGICQNILLEINLGEEDSKSGFFVEELDEICHISLETVGINVKGFMAIPPQVQAEWEKEKFFERLFQLYIDFSPKMSHNYKEFNCLSMGMSGDFAQAIAQGSTMVRIGTALFGQR
ncbi:MAG: YggS family pyridoxal phosphate-dependent enzyme [Eubacteriales bacterium]